MTKDEALDLALEALEKSTDNFPANVQHRKAITAIKQARALDKMAENDRELGLDYEPADGTQVSKVWWDGEKLMAKPIPFVEFYKPVQEPVYHLRQYGDVTKEQLDRYIATGDINPQPVPVQEPVAFFCPSQGFYWAKPTKIIAPVTVDVKPLPLYINPPAQPAPVREPVEVDQATMELAESVGLIGPASRTHDLHAAIQRFHDLICVNATIKAAKMAADAIRGSAPLAAPVQEPEWKQIAEDLRFHGLTLVKTATGYTVLKLGAVHAQATPPVAQRQREDDK
jgi:hypothetical protein